MSILRIYKFPDLVLAKRASPIERVEKELHKLADDMLETMYEAPGVGLAANQIGLLKKIIVVDADYEHAEETDEIKNPKPIILINPSIIYKEGTNAISEGCLSVPGFTSEVKRANKIKVRYQDIDGLTKELSAEGLLSIVIQHEMDHLDGKLFIDRLSPLKKQMVKKKLLQAREEGDDNPFDEPKKTKGF